MASEVWVERVLITLISPGLSKTLIKICIQTQLFYIFNNKLQLCAHSFWSLWKVKYYFHLINEERAIRRIRHFFSLHPLQVVEGEVAKGELRHMEPGQAFDHTAASARREQKWQSHGLPTLFPQSQHLKYKKNYSTLICFKKSF